VPERRRREEVLDQPVTVRSVLGLLQVALIATLLVGCSTASGGPGAAAAGGGAASPVATNQVDLPKSYRFAPTAITLGAGTTVTWTNHDNFSHNITFRDEPAVAPIVLAPGAAGTRQFTAAGRYPYICTFHPKDMTGEVIVT
jgi:plastocyanin